MTDLIAALEGLTSPSREVDALIWLEFTPGATRKQWSYIHTTTGRECHVDETRDATDRLILVPELTASLDAITALVERVLPGWTWRVATCHVSDDAWVIPDFNHPVHGERLMREFGQVEGDPSSYWQEITDVDLRPSGRPAIALCIALLRAKEARDGTE